MLPEKKGAEVSQLGSERYALTLWPNDNLSSKCPRRPLFFLGRGRGAGSGSGSGSGAERTEVVARLRKGRTLFFGGGEGGRFGFGFGRGALWIFHQPKSPWNGPGSGISLSKAPFGVKKTCEKRWCDSFQHPCGEPTVRTLLPLKPPCISYIHIILWLWMSMVQNYHLPVIIWKIWLFSSQILWTST